MTVRVLAAMGAYRVPVETVLPILEMANEFRVRLCSIHYLQHKRMIDWRNKYFPELFEALAEGQTIAARISTLETAIKAHHSAVRDRNAVTVQQRRDLKQLRQQQAVSRTRISLERKPYNDTLRAFRLWWKQITDWKNVKTLAPRRELYVTAEPPMVAEFYAQLAPPEKPLEAANINLTALRSYVRFWKRLDLVVRELTRLYQDQGLHSAIRGEIVDASAPKIKEDGPGMRYVYGRPPEPQPWEKITMPLGYGATMADLTGTATRARGESAKHYGVRLVQQPDSPDYYDVVQQIGTLAHPEEISYTVRFHRPMPSDAVLQQWTLCIRKGKRMKMGSGGMQHYRDQYKCRVMPVISSSQLAKPTGDGLFRCRLSWTVLSHGVRVARFIGAHVNEELVLPLPLMHRRMATHVAQTETDLAANEFLATRGCTPAPGARQGVVALQDFCGAYPLDNAARNRLDSCLLQLYHANREVQQAVRCIEWIYDVVTSRVCRLHGSMIKMDLELDRLKRYATRDLLRPDILPHESRKILSAVAPGKLKARLSGYGLTAIAEVEEDPPAPARGTDLFTSYVNEIGRRPLGKKRQRRDRSR